MVLRTSCRSPIVAVNARGRRREVRIAGGNISPTAQHLLAIVVLGGLARDERQPTLFELGLRFISRIGRTKRAQGIAELGTLALNRFCGASKYLARRGPRFNPLAAGGDTRGW